MVVEIDSHPPITIDTLPLSLDALGAFPDRFRFCEPICDTEELICNLEEFYAMGVKRYMRANGLCCQLPDERLWPDKYYDTYEWYRDLDVALHGHPSLVFGELTENALIHGRGLAGVAAAWKHDAFYLRFADFGQGFGTSDAHGTGWGMNFILDFATEQLRSQTTEHGHVLGICRSLRQVEVPEMSMDVRLRRVEIDRLLKHELPLPCKRPNDETHDVYDPAIGRFGAMVEYNLLGEKTGVVHVCDGPDAIED
jgi:hypothetical protein